MHTFEFATFDAFIDHAENGPTDMHQAHRSSHTISSRRDEFTGTASFPEAVTLARNGWPEGTKQMLDMLETIERFTLQQVMRPDLHMDVIGESIDVGVFCEGRPDCCQDWIEGEEPSRDNGEAITLQVNLGAPVTVKAAMIMTRGSAIVALVSALEAAGRRVRVIGVSEVMRTSDPNPAYGVRITMPLKNEGEALDIGRIAFALANPSMLRRMIFAVRETAPSHIRQVVGVRQGGNYGRSTPHVDALQANTIVFDRIEPTEHWTVDSAKRWVIAVLNGLGVQTGDGVDTERLRPDYDAPHYVEARERWAKEQATAAHTPGAVALPELPKPDVTGDDRYL